jgi:hypothetical protein
LVVERRDVEERERRRGRRKGRTDEGREGNGWEKGKRKTREESTH